MLKKPQTDKEETPNNQGKINTNSASKIKYNKPITKYCKSKIEFKPKGSNPHSY